MLGEFPKVYRVDETGRYAAGSLDELLKAADQIISAAEAWESERSSYAVHRPQ